MQKSINGFGPSEINQRLRPIRNQPTPSAHQKSINVFGLSEINQRLRPIRNQPTPSAYQKSTNAFGPSEINQRLRPIRNQPTPSAHQKSTDVFGVSEINRRLGYAAVFSLSSSSFSGRRSAARPLIWRGSRAIKSKRSPWLSMCIFML